MRGQITFGMTVSYEEEVSNLTNYYDVVKGIWTWTKFTEVYRRK